MTKRVSALIFIIFMMSFLWILTVKPPFSSPDEGFHLSRADGILQGYLILQPISPDGSSGAEVDVSLDKMAHLFNSTLRNLNPESLANSVDAMKTLKWSNVYTPKGMPNVSFYTPTVYIPQSLGFAIGKHFNLSIYSSYLLSNTLAFSLCLFLFIIAYYIYPIPLLTLVFSLIPMSIFQFMSPTIDGLSMAFTVLAMSSFMRLIDDKEFKNYKWLSLLMIVCIFSAAGSRANLLLMSFMPLWLFYKNKKYSNLIFFLICLTATFSWTIFNLINVHDSGMGRHPGYTNTELVIFYLKHPVTFLSIFFNTVTDAGNIKFYLTSMIGILGWLDAPIDKNYFIIFSITIAIALIFSLKNIDNLKDKPTSVFVLLLALLSLLLIFPALLAQWNSFPTDKIIGVQGRYFIIPVMILGYCFSYHEMKKIFELIFLGMILLLSIYSVHSALDEHYHKSSFTYEIPKPAIRTLSPMPKNLSSVTPTTYKLKVPNGNIEEASIYFGNYNNMSKGTVSLEICSQSDCKESLLNINNQNDNSYYDFKFTNHIKISNNEITLKLFFYEDAGALPVALWEYGKGNSPENLTPGLKLHYSN